MWCEDRAPALASVDKPLLLRCLRSRFTKGATPPAFNQRGVTAQFGSDDGKSIETLTAAAHYSTQLELAIAEERNG